jgi:hypothetical protein
MDPTFKPKPMFIGGAGGWKIDFRNFYNNKSIVISEVLNENDVKVYHPDSMILQEQSWNTFLRLRTLLGATFELMKVYQLAALRAKNLIFNNIPVVISTNVSGQTNESLYRQLLTSFVVKDLTEIHSDEKVSDKILQEIKTFCDDNIVNSLCAISQPIVYYEGIPTPLPDKAADGDDNNPTQEEQNQMKTESVDGNSGSVSLSKSDNADNSSNITQEEQNQLKPKSIDDNSCTVSLSNS